MWEVNKIMESACTAPDSAYRRRCELVDPITETILAGISDAEDAFPGRRGVGSGGEAGGEVGDGEEGKCDGEAGGESDV